MSCRANCHKGVEGYKPYGKRFPFRKQKISAGKLAAWGLPCRAKINRLCSQMAMARFVSKKSCIFVYATKKNHYDREGIS